MNNVDKEYFRLLDTVLQNGRVKKNRTGIDTIGIFGEQAKFDLQEGFPLLTTKKVFFKGIVHELLWFISGDTNIKYLVDNNVHIWDEWAYKRYTDTSIADIPDNELEATSPISGASLSDVAHLSMGQFIDRIKTDAAFAKKWGELGEGTYGGMWRKFPSFIHTEQGQGTMEQYEPVDQLQKVINKLRTNPDDRRLIVSAWHPYWVDYCALPPCHCMFHFNTEELTLEERQRFLHKFHGRDLRDFKGQGTKKECDYYNIPCRKLNLLLYQRSCDTFLGVPFNIASYSLLLSMMAHCVNMIPGTFTHTYGDLHIYSNHLEQVKTQRSREPLSLPTLKLNPQIKDLFAFKYEDIQLENYQSHPAIKAEVAV